MVAVEVTDSVVLVLVDDLSDPLSQECSLLPSEAYPFELDCDKLVELISWWRPTDLNTGVLATHLAWVFFALYV